MSLEKPKEKKSNLYANRPTYHQVHTLPEHSRRKPEITVTAKLTQHYSIPTNQKTISDDLCGRTPQQAFPSIITGQLAGFCTLLNHQLSGKTMLCFFCFFLSLFSGETQPFYESPEFSCLCDYLCSTDEPHRAQPCTICL